MTAFIAKFKLLLTGSDTVKLSVRVNLRPLSSSLSSAVEAETKAALSSSDKSLTDS